MGPECDHHQVAVAALAAGAAKGIGFRMDTGIALLHAAVVAAADQLARAREQRRANRNAAFGEALASFLEGDRQHLFVKFTEMTVKQRV